MYCTGYHPEIQIVDQMNDDDDADADARLRIDLTLICVCDCVCTAKYVRQNRIEFAKPYLFYEIYYLIISIN